MANHGLSDLSKTVTLSKSEYEDLIRDSECLEILRNLYAQDAFVGKAALRTVLGLEPVKESEDK